MITKRDFTHLTNEELYDNYLHYRMRAEFLYDEEPNHPHIKGLFKSADEYLKEYNNRLGISSYINDVIPVNEPDEFLSITFKD